jgi:hypothetical protein
MLFLALAVVNPARANNPYGIMTRHTGGYDSIWVSAHLQQAADLCGEWGYTRTGDGPGNEYACRRNLIMHRAKRLIPILNVTSHKPASEIASFVQNMNNEGYTIPYLEIGNEPQGEWTAANFAQHMLEVCQAVKAVSPDVKIMNGGFVGVGASYLNNMFTAVPDLVDWMDVVCCHPYSINYPPAIPGGFIDYLETVAVMDAHGFTGPIAFTEFGYELGIGLNPAYPVITEELRAEYMVDIFQNYVEADSRILAACPFILGDQVWDGWAGYDWVRFDRTTTPQFDAVAALPKPAGDDYLPSGTASLAGAVLDPALHGTVREGVGNVFVYLLPGPYADETNEYGEFAIRDVPAGTYTLSFFKDGYESMEPTKITLTGSHGVWLLAPRNGVFSAGFETGDTVAVGWQAADGQSHPEVFDIDEAVRNSGRASQRINADDSLMMWRASNYNSIFTGEVWHLAAWVRTEGLTGGDDRDGAYIRIDFRDNYFSYVGTTKVSTGIEADQDWTLLASTFVIPESGRRMQVQIGCDAESGTVWFDDLIIDRAELPLPGFFKTPAGTLTGGWNLLSLPVWPRDPQADDTLDELVWAGMTLEGNLVRHASNGAFETYPDDFEVLEPGRGYWLYLDSPVQEVISGQRVVGDATIPLNNTWTVVGYPYLEPQSWANCRVRDGETEMSMADAVATGLLQRAAYYYEEGFKLLALGAPAHDTSLRPWRGYYVRTYKPGLELIIPDPTGAGTLNGSVTDEFGEPIEGAIVSMIPGGYWDQTDAEGHYEIAGIPAGAYDLTATATEYTTGHFENAEVADGLTTTVDFVLEFTGFPTELQNPGFEQGLGGDTLAGWTRHGEVDGAFANEFYGVVPHGGIGLLGTAANWGGKQGAVYQKLSVNQGASYDISAWASVTWQGGTSGERGCRLGVDPTGGHDIGSADIVWTNWYSAPGEWDGSWHELELTGISATTNRNVLTIWLQHKQRPGGVWNITCFDDVSMAAE